MKKLAPTSWGVDQAHSNLGLADYGVGAAAYALGPGKILKPIAAGLGATGIGATALEGGLAGGASSAIADPTNPLGVAEGAAGGAALGYGAGKLGKVAGTIADAGANTGVGSGLLKLMGGASAGTPEDALAATQKAKTAAYDALKQVPIDPVHVGGAISDPMSNLDPSVQTGLSGGFKDQYNNIRQALIDQHSQGNNVDANMVDSWQRQINQAAASQTDGLVAKQINSNLNGLIKANGASDLQKAAQTANKQFEAAKNLQQWSANLKNFKASPGSAPMNEANQFYSGPGDQQGFNALGNIYQAGAASDGGLSYPLTHVGGELAEAAAAASGLGGAATMGVGAAAHLAKIPIKGLLNLYKRANLGQALRQGSEPLTGQAVGQTVPFNVGEGLKNLAFSQGSQYGY